MSPGRGGNPGPGGRSLLAPSRLVSLVAVALLASWLLASLSFPPGRDQGVFLWIGDVVRAGGAPYRDAWETKGPFAFAVAGLARTLFGDSTWGLRLVDAGFVVITVASTVALLPRTRREIAAPITLLALAVLFTRLDWWNSAQPETWATACMAIALLLVSRTTGSGAMHPAVLMAAGAMIGAAALVKPFFGAFLVVPAVYLRLDSRRTWLRGTMLLLAGVLLSVAAALAWIGSYGEGALAALLDTHVLFNASAYAATGSMSWGERIARVAGRLLAPPMLPVSVLAGVALSCGWRRRRELRDDTAGRLESPLLWSTACWAALAIGWLIVQGKLWDYQWTPLFPPIAILGGLGIRTIWPPDDPQSRVGRWQRLAATVSLALLLSGTLPAIRVVGAWFRDTILSPDPARWQRHFGAYDLDHGTYPVVARRLRDRVPEQGSALVWGMEPVVYALSGRRPKTRYGVSIPLVLGGDSPMRRAARSRFLGDLAASPPDAIVVLSRDRNQLIPWDSDVLLRGFPAFAAYVSAGYQQDTVIGNAAVLVRRRR